MTELAHDQHPETWTAVAGDYDESFAPLTGPYADVMLDHLGVGSGVELLDVACGSGACSLRAAARGATVTAVDFSPGMVELVRQRFAEGGFDQCRAEVGDGQALPLDDGAFDVATSMFGVMFFPDIAAGLRELARVTRSDGRVGVATWDRTGFRMMELVQRSVAQALPEFDLSAPEPAWAHVGHADGLADALRGAGLQDVVVHAVAHRWTFDEPEAFFRHLPAWSPPAQPLFDILTADQIDASAAAFADIVTGGVDGEEGVDAMALLGVGVAS